MKQLVETLRHYFQGGKTREIEFRIGKLKQLKKAILDREEKIEAALWDELHKSAYESYLTEISFVLQELDAHIKHVKSWSKPQKVATPLQLFGSKSRIVYEPLGVVLIIAPWNYPFQLLMSPLIGAVSAGNCAVLKPSPYTPKVGAVMREIIEAVFEPGHVVLVTGGKEVNQALLAERFDYLFFTGSPALGKVVMEAAAEYLTPVTLELGGKSPCIVGQEANLELAARRIVWGKCLNAGQTCIAPDYLFVHTSVKSRLLERIIGYIRHFYGEQIKESSDYPRIVCREAAERIAGLIENELVVYGGEVDLDSCFIAPTLLEVMEQDAPVMQEEIFGPVLPILQFQKTEEVIRYINEHDKPLALYYFGRTAEARRIMAATTSGGVCVNDTIMHIANAHLPFGGVGHSGMGRYHGKESFLTFSNRRSVLYATTKWDLPFRYPPYPKLKFLKKLPGFSS